MIPLRLRMKNFMCYRENMPTLDFEGIHVACLCGDNGSGKSSVFDAITWALWGEASRGKSNDDLIYSSPNINEMEVELEFLSGNDRYRVIRKHVRSGATKSGQSLLELQSYHQGVFKSLSEHTKSQTQDKIQGLLHLDYQTFINSAMILQGRANEFSNKRPGERKEILANILDLSFYDQLEQQARASAEMQKTESANLERDIAALMPKLAEKTSLEEAIETILMELKKIEGSQKTIDGEIQNFRREKEILTGRKEQLGLLTQQIDSKKKELQSWQKRLDDSTKIIERSESIMARTAEIESGYSEYQTIAAQDELLNEKLKILHELDRRKKPLEELVSTVQNTYNNERKTLLTCIAELTRKSGRLPQIIEQREKLLQHQRDLEKVEEDIDGKRKLVNQVTTFISTLSKLNSDLFSSMEELRKKIGMMSHAGATCPLCESELGPDGIERIEHKFSLELEQKVAQSRENVKTIADQKAELALLEKELKQKEFSFKSDYDNTKQQFAIREKEKTEAEDAGTELTLKQVALQKLEEDIKNKNYAVAELNELQSIEQEQQSLNYDPIVHNNIAERKATLQKYDGLKKELSDTQLQRESQQKARLDSETIITEIHISIENLTKQYSEIAGQITGLPKLTEELADRERRQNTLILEERSIRDRLAESKEKIKQLDLLTIEKQEKESALIRFKEDENIFAELARCFSKKGIQALIIEETLPEIENEANLLLGKMTDNRMSLSLETQRGTKKGDMIETLDIKIADELGTRTYDMYSGGESFRIDLALRIAISRLLVRRVGAAMPILIIDEGFGTQDNAGLEKLVEAINAIQDDFEKIFVITHLEELKDRFPVMINVTKTVDGSFLSVIQ